MADPGKRVDTHVATWVWKQLALAASARGLTIKAAAAEAIVDWCNRHEPKP